MTYALILAGGSGRRLWPLSRDHLPKQFLKIIKKKSMLEHTLERVRKIIPDERIFIVTNKTQKKHVRWRNVIVEPTPKGSLPAVTLACAAISGRDKDATIVILPCDHYIQKETVFRQALKKGIEIAEEGYMVLLGVRPWSLCSGYGHIVAKQHRGELYLRVTKFREKPPLSWIKRNKKENLFWNSGVYIFGLRTFLEELRRYCPFVYAHISGLADRESLKDIWEKIPADSLDKAIAQKSRRLVMVKLEAGWRDLGSWEEIYNILKKESCDNIRIGNVFTKDSKRCLLFSASPKKVLLGIGIADLIVVDTADALLVCSRPYSQAVKDILQNKIKR